MPSKKELIVTSIVGALIVGAAFLIPDARQNTGLLMFLGAVELIQVLMLIFKKDEKPKDDDIV